MYYCIIFTIVQYIIQLISYPTLIGAYNISYIVDLQVASAFRHGTRVAIMSHARLDAKINIEAEWQYTTHDAPHYTFRFHVAVYIMMLPHSCSGVECSQCLTGIVRVSS